MVKTLHCTAVRAGLISVWRTKILHAVHCGQKKKERLLLDLCIGILNCDQIFSESVVIPAVIMKVIKSALMIAFNESFLHF